MFGAADVHYPSYGGATAALVMAEDPIFAVLALERTVFVPEVAPYHSGEFYLRELPPLREVVDGVTGLDLLIIDGYVDLDPSGRPGLGAYVHNELGVPVIGVAKNRFAPATHAVQVFRGSATRPLYVTSAGVATAEAARLIQHMAGKFRLPDALRRVDALARGHVKPVTPG